MIRPEGRNHGHLLDVWSENGYSMGLWRDVFGNGALYIIHCPEHTWYQSEIAFLEYAQQLRRYIHDDTAYRDWYVDEQHVPHRQRNDTNVWGLEPLDLNNLPALPVHDHYWNICTGRCWDCNTYQADQFQGHHWSDDGVCMRCDDYNEDFNQNIRCEHYYGPPGELSEFCYDCGERRP